MAVPSPTVPSATTAISRVGLNPTQNNKAFYLFSGIVEVNTDETTVISINDIGPRDIFIATQLGWKGDTNSNCTIKFKNNGTIVFQDDVENSGTAFVSASREWRFIIPANTSFEVTLEFDVGTYDMTIAGYGNYIEGRLP